MDEPFDFVRYFARVHEGTIWRRMQREMASWAGVRSSQRLLDVGSGPGRLIDELRQAGVAAVGADGDPRMGVQFRAMYPWPYVAAHAEKLPFATGSFDAVTAGNILFFLPMPLWALREMVRVARPGATIVVWNPSERMSVTAMERYVAGRSDIDSFERTHLPNWARVGESNRRWSGEELAELFGAAGLENFETKTTLDGLARYGRGRKPA